MKKIISIFLFYLAFTTLLKAEPAILNKIEIAPLNRAKLYFSAEPVNFNAKISNDKLKISLLIRNSKVGSLNETKGAGAIENIYAKQIGADLEIGVALREKKGFTSLYLPFSKIIQVETFEWGKLPLDEDAYRSGLLALEDDLKDAARDYFKKAAEANYPNSLALLGILDLKDGKISLAHKNFINALKLKSDISDIYAGLSQIYKIKNDGIKAKAYSDAFKKVSGLEPFYLNISQIDSSQKLENIINEDSLLAAIVGVQDTAKAKSNIDTSKKIIAIDSSAQKTQDNQFLSFIPNWVYYLIGAIVFLILFSTLILYKSYLKWKEELIARRKRNAEKKTVKDKSQLREEVKHPLKPIINEEEELEDFKPYTSKIFNRNSQKKDNRNAKKDKAPNANFTEKLSILLDNYAENISQTEDTDRYGFEAPEHKQESAPADAKMEFAKRLQDQKTRSKFDKIDLIESENSGDEDLAEKAKKMRLEHGSIETKQSLNMLENNEEKLKELRKKMSGKD